MTLSGRMRHRVTIERRTARTRDAAGHRKGKDRQDWSALCTAWAEVMPLSGRELWTAQQVQPDISHRVTMRYRSGVTPAMRVRHGGRTLNIESVINDGELGASMQLLCREVL